MSHTGCGHLPSAQKKRRIAAAFRSGSTSNYQAIHTPKYYGERSSPSDTALAALIASPFTNPS